MGHIDYRDDVHAREQATLRLLIWLTAAVLISMIGGCTAFSIVERSVPIMHDMPTSRVEIRGDYPQRFEFVTPSGRVAASIVVRP